MSYTSSESTRVEIYDLEENRSSQLLLLLDFFFFKLPNSIHGLATQVLVTGGKKND